MSNLPKSATSVTHISGDLYEATDGSQHLRFTIDPYFHITVVDKDGQLKSLSFVGSNAMMVLKVGRMLKHAAGHATKLKEEANNMAKDKGRKEVKKPKKVKA